MTVKEKMESMLEQHGLWPEEAEEVMKRVAALPQLENMARRWQDNIEGYPSQLFTSVWPSVRDTAIALLKETKPEHFALAILEGKYDI